MAELTAGISQADITPLRELELGGYPHYPRYNTGVHDPLFAACLYINAKGSELALVTLDLLFFSRQHVLEVARRVEEQCGISGECIMISCSHTHSGPWAAGRLDIEGLMSGVQQDRDYTGFLISSIVRVIITAKRTAFPAQFGYAKHPCGKEQGVGGNRRDTNGPCDPFVYVLAVRDEAEKIRAVLVNYALHPTVLHEDSTLVSADFPCYIRNLIKEHYEGAITLFAQGTSGDQSTRYYRLGQSFSEAERVGRVIGRAAAEAVEGMHFAGDVNISVVNAEVPLTLRSVPDIAELQRRVDEARTRYDESVRGNAPYLDVQNANLSLLGAEDLLGYAIMMRNGKRIELLEDEQPARVQVARVGCLAIVGLPGEVFVQYGLDLKNEISAEMIIVNTLTNGCLPGYLCTQAAYQEGGYEADSSLLSPDFGKILLQTVTELANLSPNFGRTLLQTATVLTNET